MCRRVSADADQRRARARAEWKKRRRRAAAKADREANRAKADKVNRAKLCEAVDAYLAIKPDPDFEDVITLLMLLTSKAAQVFADLNLLEDETLILIDDCVTARQIANGERKTLLATHDREWEVRAISRRGDKAAARSRANAWLKSSVLRLSGRPNIKRVAALCCAILGAEISEAAVKRARTQEELLDRRGIPFGMSIVAEQARKSIAIQNP
jgi:hypothetical protein